LWSYQRDSTASTVRGSRGFGAGVTTTDDDDVEFIITATLVLAFRREWTQVVQESFVTFIEKKAEVVPRELVFSFSSRGEMTTNTRSSSSRRRRSSSHSCINTSDSVWWAYY
jgi:hypothetical protein